MNRRGYLALALAGVLFAFSLTPAGAQTAATSVHALRALLASSSGSSSGAAMVGYKHGATGSTGRTVKAKLQERVSIEDFGASPSASAAANSTAIQAALDTGKPVFIPEGEYTYDTGLTIPRTGAAVLYGLGPNKSILKYTGNAAALAFKSDVVNVIRAPQLRDFKIDATASTATYGLRLANNASGNGFSWGEFRNLYIHGPGTASSVGLAVEFGVYSTFENVVSRAWDTPIDVLKVSSSSSNLTFRRCIAIDGTTYGFRIRAESWGITFDGTNVEGDSTYGYYVEGFGSGTFPERHVFINATTEDDHATADFYFKNAINVTMTGGGPGTNTTGDGIYLENVRSSRFRDVTFSTTDNAKFGLVVDTNSQNNVIEGYSRDTRNLSAFNIVNKRNIWKFNFSSNGTSPQVYGGGGPAYSIRTTTGGTIDPRDGGTYIADASGGNITLTLSTVNAQNEGVELEIKKKPGDTNTVTIDPSGAQTVDAGSTFVMRYDEEALKLRADATLGGWRIVGHDNPSAYSSVASAASLVLPANARVVSVTGTTSVTDMAVTGFKGKVVTLIFSGILTFTDGNKLKLAGGANFTTSADDTITLACDGSNWFELSRAVN